MKDPRFPALPVLIEEDPEHVIVTEDGEVRRHHFLTFSEEDVERIRQGYCCVICGESQVDHGAPFPENCWVCKFPMRDQQTQRFELEFKGNVKVGPDTTPEEELAIAEELYRRENFTPKPSIIVPRFF